MRKGEHNDSERRHRPSILLSFLRVRDSSTCCTERIEARDSSVTREHVLMERNLSDVSPELASNIEPTSVKRLLL